MQHRNALSLIRRYTLVGLCCLVMPSVVLAEADEPFSLLSLFAKPSPNVLPDALEEALVVHELKAAPPVSEALDLTMRPDDLWVRLRNGFAMTNLNDDLVLHYQQWYQNRPDALRRMVERSRPYMHHIVKKLEERGMPTELALLPMVESSFNPMAYSRSHASGLWQFIPATGKRFNLEQNWWQDQRRDIVASTDAALEYLQTIYDMHGDWHLALASYNWGEGAVKRAIEKNMARGLDTDYASLTMPNETRHYVPKLQALKNIFGNPVLMLQLGLPEIMNRPYFATVEMGKPVDVKTAARLANMPLQEFLALNPSHNRPVIKGYTQMAIPTEKLKVFQSNLESNTEPLSAWQAYTLKPGEKLNKLAPRFGIPLADLLRVNGLQGKIKLGSGATLLVPSGKGGGDLGDLPMVPSLPQIVEPEPVRATSKPVAKEYSGKKDSKGKTAKGGKAAVSAKPAAGKAGTKAPAGKNKAENVSKPASKSTGKTAVPNKGKEMAKPAVNTKSSAKTVAKPAAKVARASKEKNG